MPNTANVKLFVEGISMPVARYEGVDEDSIHVDESGDLVFETHNNEVITDLYYIVEKQIIK